MFLLRSMPRRYAFWFCSVILEPLKRANDDKNLGCDDGYLQYSNGDPILGCQDRANGLPMDLIVQGSFRIHILDQFVLGNGSCQEGQDNFLFRQGQKGTRTIPWSTSKGYVIGFGRTCGRVQPSFRSKSRLQIHTIHSIVIVVMLLL